jgi:hypothetical protein
MIGFDRAAHSSTNDGRTKPLDDFYKVSTHIDQ